MTEQCQKMSDLSKMSSDGLVLCIYTSDWWNTAEYLHLLIGLFFFFDEKKRLTTTTCLPAFIRRGLFICLCISIKLLEFIFTTYLRFNTTMHGHANPRRRELLHLIHKQFFFYLCHLGGADVWKHNFTAHGVLFECCTPVTLFVMVLTYFIFQNDIKTAFCAPY